MAAGGSAPELFIQALLDALRDTDHMRVEGTNSSPPPPQEDKIGPAVIESSSSDTIALDDEGAPRLPKGWSSEIDLASGVIFYKSSEGETRWKMPTA